MSTTAGLTGNNGLSLGNVIGSNIFNLMAVACVCALVMSFVPDKELKLVNGSTAATRSPANVAFSLDKPADGSSSGGSGGNSGEEENPLG